MRITNNRKSCCKAKIGDQFIDTTSVKIGQEKKGGVSLAKYDLKCIIYVNNKDIYSMLQLNKVSLFP